METTPKYGSSILMFGICSAFHIIHQCTIMKKFLTATLFCMTMFVSRLSAQEAGDFGLGLFLNSSTNITATYHFTDRFAIRPSFGIALGTNENTANYESAYSTTNNAHHTEINASLDLLSYFGTSDSFTPYILIGGGFSTAQYTGTTKTTNYLNDTVNVPVNSSTSTSTSKIHGYTGRAGFGVKYALGRRMMIFGELSVNYSRYTEYVNTNRPLDTSTSSQINLSTSGIGITFYLN
ncbi:MAG: outer membrane beta-barrel protein [Candidatus Kapaibacterium sp.]